MQKKTDDFKATALDILETRSHRITTADRHKLYRFVFGGNDPSGRDRLELATIASKVNGEPQEAVA